MKVIPQIVMTLAGVAAVAGCSIPLGRIDPPARGRTILDTGTPPAKIGQGPSPRHYVDEKGATWDDRGIKQDATKEGKQS